MEADPRTPALTPEEECRRQKAEQELFRLLNQIDVEAVKDVTINCTMTVGLPAPLADAAQQGAAPGTLGEQRK